MIFAEVCSAGDWLRSAGLVARYHDLPLGTVDASVVATGGLLGAALGLVCAALMGRQEPEP